MFQVNHILILDSFKYQTKVADFTTLYSNYIFHSGHDVNNNIANNKSDFT